VATTTAVAATAIAVTTPTFFQRFEDFFLK
jgi:hypothetical protein